jgi:hypothetical protein
MLFYLAKKLWRGLCIITLTLITVIFGLIVYHELLTEKDSWETWKYDVKLLWAEGIW